jgi:hypothetical protein
MVFIIKQTKLVLPVVILFISKTNGTTAVKVVMLIVVIVVDLLKLLV